MKDKNTDLMKLSKLSKRNAVILKNMGTITLKIN